MGGIAPPTTQRGPAAERQLALYELLEARGKGVPVDEHTATRALHSQLVPADLNDATRVHEAFEQLLRTAGAFVLDANHAWEVIASGAPPEMDVLPPLPFKRVWVETSHEGRPVPYSALRGQSDPAIDAMDDEALVAAAKEGRSPTLIRGVGISETIPGQEWFVMLPCAVSSLMTNLPSTQAWDVATVTSLRGKPERTAVPRGWGVPIAFQMTPHGVKMSDAIERTIQSSESAKTLFDAMCQLVVNAAHLITARNVPHHEILLPRPQRKRLEASGAARWYRAPKIYYVDLNAAGDVTDLGKGDRTYTCRWLVAGHWMHMPPGKIGKAVCTCIRHREKPLPATFREAYVKGPPGAPWKGRPIHTDIHEEEAA